jgi:predicted DCC family thiol-disulfide oxidoreductase YuxK
MSFCFNLIAIHYYAAAIHILSYLTFLFFELYVYDYIAKNGYEWFGRAEKWDEMMNLRFLVVTAAS